MRGDSCVAGERRAVGIPKFHSWSKCTMPLTNINSDWMSNSSSGLCIILLFILYYAGPLSCILGCNEYLCIVISLYLFVAVALFILCDYYLGVVSIRGLHSSIWESHELEGMMECQKLSQSLVVLINSSGKPRHGIFAGIL